MLFTPPHFAKSALQLICKRVFTIQLLDDCTESKKGKEKRR